MNEEIILKRPQSVPDADNLISSLPTEREVIRRISGGKLDLSDVPKVTVDPFEIKSDREVPETEEAISSQRLKEEQSL